MSPPPVWLSVTCGLGPLVIMHACHAVSAAAGLMPYCLPYVQGCVSVSASGRYPPANYLFDGTMIPAALGLAVWWAWVGRWREVRSPGLGSRLLGVFGITAGCMMWLYAIFLGADEPYGRYLRRLGINGYFLFNMLAQIGLLFALRRDSSIPCGPLRIMAALMYSALLMGVFSGLEDVLELDSNRIDNVIEWNFALFMSLYFVVFAAIAHQLQRTRDHQPIRP